MMPAGTVSLNLDDVQAFTVRFVKCPQNPEAKHIFNDLYSGQLDRFLELFEIAGPGRSRADALVVDNVVTTLRDIIVNDLIVPEAINTPGTDDAAKALVIIPFITHATIMVGYYDGHRDTRTRLTTANLERIIQHGIARNIEYNWFFEVGMSHIHFTSVDADLD